MSPKLLIPLALAVTLLPIGGCTSTAPVLRGQTPDGPKIVGRLRRQARMDREAVRDAARKGLAIGGKLVLLVGCWWLDAKLDELSDPSSEGHDSQHTSRAPAESRPSRSPHAERSHRDSPSSDRKD